MAHWDVFRELDSLRREIDDAFRGFGIGRQFGVPVLSPMNARRFPLVNISEDDGHLYVDALLPGVDPKDVDLTILRNTLTIAGQRTAPAEEKGQVIHRSEMGFGTFSRTLELPLDVDPDKVSAEYRDGIMCIVLGKPETAKPKKIDIKLS